MLTDDLKFAQDLALGDEQAARFLVDRYYENISWFFVALGHSTEDASDLAQETFVKARVKAGALGEKLPLRPGYIELQFASTACSSESEN